MKKYKKLVNYFITKLFLVLVIVSVAPIKAVFASQIISISNFSFEFLGQSEAALFLGVEDDFVRSLSAFDRQLRLNRVEKTSTIDYLKHLSEGSLNWQDNEIKKLTNIITRFEKINRQFKLPMPNKVLLIKTSDDIEFGSPHTRRNAIVLPQNILNLSEDQIFELFVHELFHVLSRLNPDFRREMYSNINFENHRNLNHLLPQFRSEISNPDYYTNDWYVRITYKDQNYPAVMINTFRLVQKGIFVKSIDISSSVRTSLLLLKNDFSPVKDEKGDLITVGLNETNFYDMVGVNTEYIISPEEILADNFMLIFNLMEDVKKVKTLGSPELIDKILASRFFLGTFQNKYQSYYSSFDQITRESFFDIFNRLESLYENNFKSKGHNIDILFDLNWESSTENASVMNCGPKDINDFSGTYRFIFHGGLARNLMMSKDEYAGVVCHELGHCFGGAPIKKASNFEKIGSSVELQADYWSTSKCLKQFFEQDGKENLKWLEDKDINPYIISECSLAFGSPMDIAICIRTSKAGVGLIKILEGFGAKGVVNANVEAPSLKHVDKIERYYADTQCRLDTLFQGALCNKQADELTSLSDPSKGHCNRSEGYERGVRPLCWYKPGGEVLRPGETSY